MATDASSFLRVHETVVRVGSHWSLRVREDVSGRSHFVVGVGVASTDVGLHCFSDLNLARPATESLPSAPVDELLHTIAIPGAPVTKYLRVRMADATEGLQIVAVAAAATTLTFSSTADGALAAANLSTLGTRADMTFDPSLPRAVYLETRGPDQRHPDFVPLRSPDERTIAAPQRGATPPAETAPADAYAWSYDTAQTLGWFPDGTTPPEDYFPLRADDGTIVPPANFEQLPYSTITYLGNGAFRERGRTIRGTPPLRLPANQWYRAVADDGFAIVVSGPDGYPSESGSNGNWFYLVRGHALRYADPAERATTHVIVAEDSDDADSLAPMIVHVGTSPHLVVFEQQPDDETVIAARHHQLHTSTSIGRPKAPELPAAVTHGRTTTVGTFDRDTDSNRLEIQGSNGRDRDLYVEEDVREAYDGDDAIVAADLLHEITSVRLEPQDKTAYKEDDTVRVVVETARLLASDSVTLTHAGTTGLGTWTHTVVGRTHTFENTVAEATTEGTFAPSVTTNDETWTGTTDGSVAIVDRTPPVLTSDTTITDPVDMYQYEIDAMRTPAAWIQKWSVASDESNLEVVGDLYSVTSVTPGSTYTVTFRSTDSAGNSTTLQRSFRVVADPAIVISTDLNTTLHVVSVPVDVDLNNLVATGWNEYDVLVNGVVRLTSRETTMPAIESIGEGGTVQVEFRNFNDTQRSNTLTVRQLPDARSVTEPRQLQNDALVWRIQSSRGTAFFEGSENRTSSFAQDGDVWTLTESAPTTAAGVQSRTFTVRNAYGGEVELELETEVVTTIDPAVLGGVFHQVGYASGATDETSVVYTSTMLDQIHPYYPQDESEHTRTVSETLVDEDVYHTTTAAANRGGARLYAFSQSQFRLRLVAAVHLDDAFAAGSEDVCDLRLRLFGSDEVTRHTMGDQVDIPVRFTVTAGRSLTLTIEGTSVSHTGDVPAAADVVFLEIVAERTSFRSSETLLRARVHAVASADAPTSEVHAFDLPVATAAGYDTFVSSPVALHQEGFQLLGAAVTTDRWVTDESVLMRPAGSYLRRLTCTVDRSVPPPSSAVLVLPLATNARMPMTAVQLDLGSDHLPRQFVHVLADRCIDSAAKGFLPRLEPNVPTDLLAGSSQEISIEAVVYIGGDAQSLQLPDDLLEEFVVRKDPETGQFRVEFARPVTRNSIIVTAAGDEALRQIFLVADDALETHRVRVLLPDSFRPAAAGEELAGTIYNITSEATSAPHLQRCGAFVDAAAKEINVRSNSIPHHAILVAGRPLFADSKDEADSDGPFPDGVDPRHLSVTLKCRGVTHKKPLAEDPIVFDASNPAVVGVATNGVLLSRHDGTELPATDAHGGTLGEDKSYTYARFPERMDQGDRVSFDVLGAERLTFAASSDLFHEMVRQDGAFSGATQPRGDLSVFPVYPNDTDFTVINRSAPLDAFDVVARIGIFCDGADPKPHRQERTYSLELRARDGHVATVRTTFWFDLDDVANPALHLRVSSDEHLFSLVEQTMTSVALVPHVCVLRLRRTVHHITELHVTVRHAGALPAADVSTAEVRDTVTRVDPETGNDARGESVLTRRAPLNLIFEAQGSDAASLVPRVGAHGYGFYESSHTPTAADLVPLLSSTGTSFYESGFPVAALLDAGATTHFGSPVARGGFGAVVDGRLIETAVSHNSVFSRSLRFASGSWDDVEALRLSVSGPDDIFFTGSSVSHVTHLSLDDAETDGVRSRFHDRGQQCFFFGITRVVDPTASGALDGAVLRLKHGHATPAFVVGNEVRLRLAQFGLDETVTVVAVPDPRHLHVSVPTGLVATVDLTLLDARKHINVLSPAGADDLRDPRDHEINTLLQTPGGHSPIVGVAADGYPIYGSVGTDEQTWDSAAPPSTRLLTSSYGETSHQFEVGRGDLDARNGIFSATPEFPSGVYHYVCTVRPGATGLVSSVVADEYNALRNRQRFQLKTGTDIPGIAENDQLELRDDAAGVRILVEVAVDPTSDRLFGVFCTNKDDEEALFSSFAAASTTPTIHWLVHRWRLASGERDTGSAAYSVSSALDHFEHVSATVEDEETSLLELHEQFLLRATVEPAFPYICVPTTNNFLIEDDETVPASLRFVAAIEFLESEFRHRVHVDMFQRDVIVDASSAAATATVEFLVDGVLQSGNEVALAVNPIDLSPRDVVVRYTAGDARLERTVQLRPLEYHVDALPEVVTALAHSGERLLRVPVPRSTNIPSSAVRMELSDARLQVAEGEIVAGSTLTESVVVDLVWMAEGYADEAVEVERVPLTVTVVDLVSEDVFERAEKVRWGSPTITLERLVSLAVAAQRGVLELANPTTTVVSNYSLASRVPSLDLEFRSFLRVDPESGVLTVRDAALEVTVAGPAASLESSATTRLSALVSVGRLDAFEFQWERDGVAVDGETSATLDVAGDTEDRAYRVRVRNPATGVDAISPSVLVRRNRLLRLKQQLPPVLKLVRGATARLQVASTGGRLRWSTTAPGRQLDMAALGDSSFWEFTLGQPAQQTVLHLDSVAGVVPNMRVVGSWQQVVAVDPDLRTVTLDGPAVHQTSYTFVVAIVYRVLQQEVRNYEYSSRGYSRWVGNTTERVDMADQTNIPRYVSAASNLATAGQQVRAWAGSDEISLPANTYLVRTGSFRYPAARRVTTYDGSVYALNTFVLNWNYAAAMVVNNQLPDLNNRSVPVYVGFGDTVECTTADLRSRDVGIYTVEVLDPSSGVVDTSTMRLVLDPSPEDLQLEWRAPSPEPSSSDPVVHEATTWPYVVLEMPDEAVQKGPFVVYDSAAAEYVWPLYTASGADVPTEYGHGVHTLYTTADGPQRSADPPVGYPFFVELDVTGGTEVPTAPGELVLLRAGDGTTPLDLRAAFEAYLDGGGAGSGSVAFDFRTRTLRDASNREAEVVGFRDASTLWLRLATPGAMLSGPVTGFLAGTIGTIMADGTLLRLVEIVDSVPRLVRLEAAELGAPDSDPVNRTGRLRRNTVETLRTFQARRRTTTDLTSVSFEGGDVEGTPLIVPFASGLQVLCEGVGIRSVVGL